MDQETSGESNNRFPIIAMVVVLLTIFLAVVVLVFTRSQKKQNQPAIPSQQITPTVSSGSSLQIKAKEGGGRFSKNQEVGLIINGSSEGKEIVGFDLLMAYDQTAFDMIKVSSILPDFKIYNYRKKDYLSLTAIKSIQQKGGTIIKDTSLVELVLKPKKTGSFVFSLRPEMAKEKTNFVDTKSQLIHPQLSQISLEIY